MTETGFNSENKKFTIGPGSWKDFFLLFLAIKWIRYSSSGLKGMSWVHLILSLVTFYNDYN